MINYDNRRNYSPKYKKKVRVTDKPTTGGIDYLNILLLLMLLVVIILFFLKF